MFCETLGRRAATPCLPNSLAKRSATPKLAKKKDGVGLGRFACSVLALAQTTDGHGADDRHQGEYAEMVVQTCIKINSRVQVCSIVQSHTIVQLFTIETSLAYLL